MMRAGFFKKCFRINKVMLYFLLKTRDGLSRIF